jgi:hypothetical protein
MQLHTVNHTNCFQGETIPIRLFLGGFDLTPTFREVNKKYSTRYYLSLVLIDEGRPFISLSPYRHFNLQLSIRISPGESSIELQSVCLFTPMPSFSLRTSQSMILQLRLSRISLSYA